jgi:DNA polymerase-3 subunit delta
MLTDQERVVIFWEEGAPKEKEKLFQYLHQKAKKQKFDLLSGPKLNEWIVQEAQKINPNISFSRPALNILAGYVSDDGQRLSLEIKKIVDFKGEGEITPEEVEALVKSSMQANIFETVEALSGGNKSKALELYHRQLEGGDDPFYVLSMYVYQFRNLLKMGEFFYAGEQNAYNLAKLAGLHPFVVQKGMSQLRRTSLEKIKATYQKLSDLDLKIKTGELEPKLALDKFIVEC